MDLIFIKLWKKAIHLHFALYISSKLECNHYKSRFDHVILHAKSEFLNKLQKLSCLVLRLKNYGWKCQKLKCTFSNHKKMDVFLKMHDFKGWTKNLPNDIYIFKNYVFFIKYVLKSLSFKTTDFGNAKSKGPKNCFRWVNHLF
jgi:hypothetical protein